jgi:hypothetical protein
MKKELEVTTKGLKADYKKKPFKITKLSGETVTEQNRL